MDKILKEAPQVWLVRDIPPSQGTLPLTQVEFPQSTGGNYIKKNGKKRLLEAKKIKA